MDGSNPCIGPSQAITAVAPLTRISTTGAHTQVRYRVPSFPQLCELTVRVGNSIQVSASVSSSSSHNPSTSVQQSPPSAISRLRAASSAFPSGLNLRNQYRTLPLQNSTPAVPAPRSNSFSSSFSTGYASAPLAAPVDFSLSRAPVGTSGHGRRDFSIPQLSAPIVPPPDFHSAYSSNLSPPRTTRGDREFGSQGSNMRDIASLAPVQTGDKQQSRNHDVSSYLGSNEHNSGQTRKRSFTMPGGFGGS